MTTQKAQEIRAKMRALTASQPSAHLAVAFHATDDMIDAAVEAGNVDEFTAIAEARGVIIDVLVERGEEALVGL